VPSTHLPILSNISDNQIESKLTGGNFQKKLYLPTGRIILKQVLVEKSE
jgi:hypothetical protein